MTALLDHPADAREAFEASCLVPAKRIRLEVRNYVGHELAGRPTFVLESPVGLRFADPPAPEERRKTLEERTIPLVQ